LDKCVFRLSQQCVHPVHRGATDDARCASCAAYAGPPRGVGDVIHRALDSTGIHKVLPPCFGCTKRRAALNAAMPFTDEPRKD
jgi:hypothetical protein